MIKVPSAGPCPAEILIVGEAPGVQEELRRTPFVGASGEELDRMLKAAGIDRRQCRVTNVCQVRPPFNDISHFIAKSKRDITSEHVRLQDRFVLPAVCEGFAELRREIARCNPRVIIALGNLALWALTGHWGILKWRGSYLYHTHTFSAGDATSDRRAARQSVAIPVIPTVHPAAVLREWKLRRLAVHDFRRAAALRSGTVPNPDWRFIIRPSYNQALSRLNTLQQLAARAAGPGSPGQLGASNLRIAVDIETRHGHIACIGLAWSKHEAICIPLLTSGANVHYWTEAQEREIVSQLYHLLTHPGVEVIGQNFLYDAQYFAHWLGFVPNLRFDTMIAQHALFSALPKGLAFLASLYCTGYYRYWKDEGKDWAKGQDEAQLWHYNCLDCVYTYEVAEELAKTTAAMERDAVQSCQQDLFRPVLAAMLKGIGVSADRRKDLKDEIAKAISERNAFLTRVLGHELNVRSPAQMKRLFYDDLRLPPQMTRAAKGKAPRVTLDDEALRALAVHEPLVRPLVNAISDIRTMGIFLSSFIEAPLDPDGRMRCSFNIGGNSKGKSAPVTYRLSSSSNAFGRGCNLQTIPSRESRSQNKLEARGSARLPDLRTMFVPDPGTLFWNGDLDRADLQVVVWEAGDEGLKQALRAGVDLHLLNAFVLAERTPPAAAELVKGHPAYNEHRTALAAQREFAKAWVHGTNYGGSARTMAINCGVTVRESERAQALWFNAHPGIRAWHARTREQVFTHRFVENRFGYRWYIFDRLDEVLPEALAWIPQSTVSVYINRIWQRLWNELPEVEVLLQVHDSLAGQIPLAHHADLVPKMRDVARIEIPYPGDPLVIPFTIKTSEVSWGDCQ